MNRIRTFALLAVALLAMAASVPALAEGGYRGGNSGGNHGGNYAGHYGAYHGGYYRGYYRGYYGYPRVSFGFVYGGPGYWGYPGYYYPPPYYYYPQAVGMPAQPTVYTERGDAYAPPEQSQGYWHYCPETKAYYPYVKHCAGGWQRVSPTPPPG